jgi:hypothetical protein
MTSVDHRFAGARIIRNQAIGKRRDDPLPSLLVQLLARAGESATIERSASRPWASALFQGRRHFITLRLQGADAESRRDRLLEDLPEAEWTLSGHFVGDIFVDRHGHDEDGLWLDLTALTVEDW